jgi:hypothetical protein
MIGALIGLVVLAVVGVLIVVLAMAMVGVVIGLLAALIGLTLKLVPFLFLGWLAVKLVQRAERPRRRVGISMSDREWLDSPGY